MNDIVGGNHLSRGEALLLVGAHCAPDDPHCITCSDEALVARVIRLDEADGMALVVVEDWGDDATADVDVSLVDDLAPGELILIHGGVAIAHVEGSRGG